MTDPNVFKTILRNNLTSFIQRCFNTVSPGDRFQGNWHIQALAWHLEQCLNGEFSRLAITIPPRNLKSIAASVAFPAFLLGHDPKAKIVAASYSQDLANKHSVDCRRVLEAAWYREIFPVTRVDPAKKAEGEFRTTLGGYRLATSLGGTLTGRGGDVIIIDDPIKPDEAPSDAKRQAMLDWYRSTLLSRLNDKTAGTIILIQQRVHEEDLVGHVLRSGDWVHLNLPAIAEERQEIRVSDAQKFVREPGDVLHPEREPKETLEQLKEQMGSYAFAAQYQQSPAPLGGGLIKWQWFGSYGDVPEKAERDRIIQSWDTASKAEEVHDYSDKGSGTQLIQDLRNDGIRHPQPFKPKDDKVMRLVNQTAVMEAGKVLLPDRAPWLADFQTELMQFPNGRHDDQVDSLSQFLAWMAKKRHRPRISTVPTEVIYGDDFNDYQS